MNRPKKLETAETPKSGIQTKLTGNPYKDGTIVRCALKGTRACPDNECDGFNRRCTVWVRHSSK